MSLATSGGIGGMGGAGGGGLTMAHPANAMAVPTMNAPPPGAEIPAGMAPPSTAAAALGADLVDKQQQLSLKQVKDVSHLPLVGVDLFSSTPIVASFPAKGSEKKTPELVGKMKNQIALQSNESSHKTLRKWLSKSKTYADLQASVFGKSGDDKKCIILENPEKWLGLRRLDDAPAFLRSSVATDSEATPAIAEEASSKNGVTMTNGTLDGSVPQGDDFDRVVAKVKLCPEKKALTILPEEATQLLLNQAQHHVARKHKEEDEDTIEMYPVAVAVPAPYCTDSAMEAMMDATGGAGVMFQRSTCALAGAILPSTGDKKNAIMEHINKVLQAKHKEYQIALAANPDAQFEEDQILLLSGLTSDTVECTAIEMSHPQRDLEACIFGNFRVLANVSYKSQNPQAKIQKCISELYEVLDATAPEADGPVAMITYGSPDEQSTLKEKWGKVQKNLEDWEEIPQFPTKPDAVAMGISVLGAVSHGRLTTIAQVQGKKPKAQLAIRVQNVAPVAVGVKMNYHGGASNKWLPVKTIFDFDRRVPAGPYQIELSAAECAVYQSGKTSLGEEELLKAIANMQGSSYIPKREQAALDLRVQIVQKWTRDGQWNPIGNVTSPLVTIDRDEKKTACESVGLELSLGATGLITHSLVGERESVVQAVKTARNSALRYYLGIFLAVAFFGGFLVKSYWEEKVFERDTSRLLSYYKHVIPGSVSDGDLHNARYLVWKYRNKKEKLWKNLEKKYGEPVLHEHEWPEEEEGEEEEEEHQNLDEETEGEENEEQDL